MIIHLLSDPDFNSSIITQFETANYKKNIYVVFKIDQFEAISKSHLGINILLIDPNNFTFNFERISGVIIHCLSIHSATFVLRTPKNIPVLWSIFGVDLYNFMPSLQSKIYGPKTKEYLYGKSFLAKLLYHLKLHYCFNFKSNNIIQRKAIRKVKFYSTVMPNETVIAKFYLPKHIEYKKLDVGHLPFLNKESITVITKKTTTKKQIYIGNSGNESNNHLDLVDEIKKLAVNQFQINIQLSYGGASNYIEYVKKEYLAITKNKINIIDTWMNKSEYLDLVNSQDIFLFNSIRQQGVGAIIMAIWCGAKVYLNSKNFVYKYYKSIGLKIFSIQNEFNDLHLSFESLSNNEIINNRRILLQEYDFESVNGRTLKAISTLYNYAEK